MRIHIIACRVLTRELSYLISQSPHTVDITWLPQGLHDTPEKLRALIADAIDGLYRQREPLYRAAADFSVENTGLPKAAAEAAARGLDLR